MLDPALLQPAEGETPAAAQEEDEAGADTTIAPSATGLSSAKRSARGAGWFVWGGSAALLGLFIAGFAYDLSHESSSSGEEPLPYFPNAP